MTDTEQNLFDPAAETEKDTEITKTTLAVTEDDIVVDDELTKSTLKSTKCRIGLAIVVSLLMTLLIFLSCFIRPKDSLENTKLSRFKSSINSHTSDLEYLCKYCRNYKDKQITKYLEEECDIMQKLENHLNGKNIYDLITNENNDINYLRDILFIIRIQKILLDLVTPDGDTPLTWAVQNNDIDVVKLLILEGGCDVSLQDADENTPLHIAFSEKNDEIVSFLISNGARNNLRNRQGKLPVQMFDSIMKRKPQ